MTERARAEMEYRYFMGLERTLIQQPIHNTKPGYPGDGKRVMTSNVIAANIMAATVFEVE